MGLILVVVRGRIYTINSTRNVEMKFVVKFSTCFLICCFMFLFYFDANVCRFYVSFILDAFLEELVWDDMGIVRLLVLVLRRICL